MNAEDATITDAVSKVASEIAQSIDLIVRRYRLVVG